MLIRELQERKAGFLNIKNRFVISFNRMDIELFPHGLNCNMDSSLGVLKDIQTRLCCKVIDKNDTYALLKS